MKRRLWRRVTKMWQLILLLLACFKGIESYKAAVVHYYPANGNTPNDTIWKNLEQYHKYASKASKKGVDIIVFPEYGLVTTLALYSPKRYAFEISTDHQIIKKLSTIAIENKLYLVVNVFEQSEENDLVKYYNTNLVFDRNGTLILKHRKIHLYNEHAFSPGSLSQNSVFKSDFGTTFAIFTCFDILFVNPSQTVLQGSNVTDIIFVTGWLPSYISSSVQHGYALANGVNLLSANHGRIDGHTGTGIYYADGTPAETVDSAESYMVLREVPIKSQRKERICSKSVVTSTKRINEVPEVKDIHSSGNYKFYDLDLTQKKTFKTVCSSNNFCCSFEIMIDVANSSDIYRLLIFEKSTYYENSRADFRSCTLMACQNDSEDSCGAVAEVNTKFTKIKVQAQVTRANSTFYRPITLNSKFSPLKYVSYCSLQGENNLDSVQVSAKEQKNVIIYGLYGRSDAVTESVTETQYSTFRSFLVLFWGRPYYFNLFK